MLLDGLGGVVFLDGLGADMLLVGLDTDAVPYPPLPMFFPSWLFCIYLIYLK